MSPVPKTNKKYPAAETHAAKATEVRRITTPTPAKRKIKEQENGGPGEEGGALPQSTLMFLFLERLECFLEREACDFPSMFDGVAVVAGCLKMDREIVQWDIRLHREVLGSFPTSAYVGHLLHSVLTDLVPQIFLVLGGDFFLLVAVAAVHTGAEVTEDEVGLVGVLVEEVPEVSSVFSQSKENGKFSLG
ncbi:hypothetical protein RHMOL_Rhmol05G0186300 [Rhododendron molle]|uniref:Uncharacterized protein n=1 Tax=Rhododendron molle TaxID=49168 RepID=A0ACC0NS73_RHOML|nr:hypothetical protein RHMOL_Rhmol05G0186300 [Rhododendron molle]